MGVHSEDLFLGFINWRVPQGWPFFKVWVLFGRCQRPYRVWGRTKWRGYMA